MLLADYRTCGSRPQANDDVGLDLRKFSLQPRTACGDFGVGGLLVNATLAALFEFEMFDCVRNVHIRTVDARVFERAVQQTAGRPDEWLSGEIFLVAGLLAHNDDARARRALPENCLRRVPVDFARLAFPGQITQLGERRTVSHHQLRSEAL